MAFPAHRTLTNRRLVLFVGDVIGIAGSMVLATFLRFRGMDAAWHEYIVTHLPSLSTIGFVFLLVFYAAGLYERQTLSRNANITALLAATVGIAMMLNMAMFYLRFELTVGRGILLFAGLLIFLSARGLRSLYRIAIGYGVLSREALIVGSGDMVKDVLNLLKSTEDTGFNVSGVVTASEIETCTSCGDASAVGLFGNLQEIASTHQADTIIFATPLLRAPDLLRALRPLRRSGLEILDYVTLREKISQKISIDHIDDGWLLNAATHRSVAHLCTIKRAIDICGSMVGMIVCAPIALIAAILIKLDSPGPILYRQLRARMDNESYTLLKFRTMYKDAELKSGARWADEYDERVTPIGTFLRKWRIDEIPQLVNVLKGEMSLVGPRPERPEFIDTLAEEIPYYRERLLVPPGMTGWAQIRFPYAASIEASRRKLQYDLYYYKNMSFLLDLQILLQTLRAILCGIRHSVGVIDESAPKKVEPLKVLPTMSAEAKKKSA